MNQSPQQQQQQQHSCHHDQCAAYTLRVFGQLLRIFIPNTNNPNTKHFQISKIQITRTAFGGGQNSAIKQYFRWLANWVLLKDHWCMSKGTKDNADDNQPD